MIEIVVFNHLLSCSVNVGLFIHALDEIRRVLTKIRTQVFTPERKLNTRWKQWPIYLNKRYKKYIVHFMILNNVKKVVCVCTVYRTAVENAYPNWKGILNILAHLNAQYQSYSLLAVYEFLTR